MTDEQPDEVVTNGDVAAEMPAVLADLLVEFQGWEKDAPKGRSAGRAAPAEEDSDNAVVPLPAETGNNRNVNHEAAHDDDLPDGIVFADSAYETVIDPETGEKVRVLKTHCRNGHEYAGANVKIVLRGTHAYRECQTCKTGRKARAAAKRAASKN